MPSLVAFALLLGACVTSGDEYALPPVGGDDLPSSTLQDPVPVLRVVDGDTLEVRLDGYTRRVRMKGVDTPEMNVASATPPEPWAEQALAYTRDNVGTQVDLEFDSHCPTPPQANCVDMYDRLLAYVRVASGADHGAELLERGLARVYVFEGEQFDRRDEYEGYERAAQAADLGVWSP